MSVFLRIVIFSAIFMLQGFSRICVGQVADDQSLIAFGDHLFRQGDYYRAITEYERFLFLHPDHLQAGAVELKIAAAYYYGEKWPAATERLQKLAAREPQSEAGRMAILYLAATALKQKEYALACDYLEAFVEKFPEDAQKDAVACELVLTHIRRHDMAEAERLMSVLLQKEPVTVCLTMDDLDLWKMREQKSPILAGVFSAILPGAGQGYVGQWSDASLAFLLNAVFFLGTYEAFRQDENVTGCFLLSLDATWYFGNIYNAVNGARKFNQLQEDRFFQNVSLRYGLVFPPDSKDIPVPVIGISGQF